MPAVPKLQSLHEQSNLLVALDLASRGLVVFPIIKVKVEGEWTWQPWEKGYQNKATADADTISAWWRDHPHATVGLLCGPRNGITVLDVDEKNGTSGSATLADYGFGDIEAMSPVRTRSPSGGWHLYFAHEPDLRNWVGSRRWGHADWVMAGLDIKGGGPAVGPYVIAPGAWKDGQQYVPEGCALGSIDLPQWPRALIPPPKPEYVLPYIVTEPTDEQREWAADELAKWAAEVRATPEGGRWSALNDAALWSGGIARHGVLSLGQVQEALEPAGLACGLPSHEVNSTIKIAWEDGLRKPRALPLYLLIDEDDFEDLEPLPALNAIAPSPANDDQPADAEAAKQPDAKPKLKPKSKSKADTVFGDVAMGAEAGRRMHNRFRYVSTEKAWHHWDGARWAPCQLGQHVEEMKRIAADVFTEAALAYGRAPTAANKVRMDGASAYLKSGPKLSNAIGLAQTEDGIVSSPDMFDADRYAFTVSNGVIDLRTLKLSPATPEMMIRKRANVTFDRDATAPQWEAFLARVLPDDDVRAYVQRAVGYTLTGSTDEEKWFVCVGSGANGKSVFANVFGALLGDYREHCVPELLTKSSNSEGRVQSANLPGKRLVLIDETAQGAVWDDGRVKMLTGREPITTRFHNGQYFTFQGSHKIWLRTNNLPGAHDGSHGFWRRLVAIRFGVSLAPQECIPDLHHVIIREELPGVLNWALAGVQSYLRQGLKEPHAVSAEIADYKTTSDVLGNWIEDCLHRGDGVAPVGSLYDSYALYSRSDGVKAPSKSEFTRQMAARGFVRGRHGKYRIRVFLDCELRPQRGGMDEDDGEEDLIG